MRQNKALILLNLGTPDSTKVTDVRKYLKEFLSDPRVIDINPVARWLLLHLFILPFRPSKSAEAYNTIWGKEGSPLLVHTKNLTEKIQARVGKSVHVTYMMRYQQPSIPSVMETLKQQGFDKITVVPLFPQYSSAASGSAMEAVYSWIKNSWNVPEIEILSEFYQEPEFIHAFAEIGRKALEQFQADKVMFSFHGLPKRHCIKSDQSPGKDHCLKKPDCCDKIVDANRRCYRAQCVATAQLLANALNLGKSKWEIAFQSRLGRTPWITPYTDERVCQLPSEGVRRLAVYSPAFVADCLETLEEIAIRAESDFIQNGGEELMLIPSLNSEDVWVEGLEKIINRRSAILNEDS